jgi:phenylacetate-CoA ligase
VQRSRDGGVGVDLGLIARVLVMRRSLRAREGWSGDRIARYRQQELERLRRHLYKKSPFYRRFHASLEGRPLHELPVLTKGELMSNFDELVSDRKVRLAEVREHLESLNGGALFRGRYRVARTAGSTGNPGIFLCSRREWPSVIASYSRAQEWAGIFARVTESTRLAVVSSRVPWHQSARVGASVDSPFVPVRRFDSTDPLDGIVAGLNAWLPANLIAYASMLNILADEQWRDACQSIRPPLCPRRRCLPKRLENVCDRRGGTSPSTFMPRRRPPASHPSALSIGSTSSRISLSPRSSTTKTDPVLPGEYGAKLLVTVLFSRTQPLIRYEMSDRVMLSPEPCSCGLPFAVLGGIEGRAEDILHLPTASGELVSIHPNVFHELLEKLPVQAWQVLEEPERIRVLLARLSQPMDLDRVQLDVARALEQRGVLRRVSVEPVDAVTKTAMGKAPLVRSWRLAASRRSSLRVQRDEHRL